MKLEVETASSAVLHCNTTPSLELLNMPISMPHALGVVPEFETVWAQNGASFTITQLNYLLTIFWVSMDIEPDFPPEIEATQQVTKCPLCNKKYVLEVILYTHILAHINYFQGIGNKQFNCAMCPFDVDHANVLCAHLVQNHAQKMVLSKNAANRILASNIQEKDLMILRLGQPNDNESANRLLPIEAPYYHRYHLDWI